MKQPFVADEPRLIAEWDVERNLPLDPAKVTLASDKTVWWNCQQGHQWRTRVRNRELLDKPPVCARHTHGAKMTRNAVAKHGRLSDLHPELASEWHPAKNYLTTKRRQSGQRSCRLVAVSSGARMESHGGGACLQRGRLCQMWSEGAR